MRPVFAQPGYTESDVLALIDSGAFIFTDCYTIAPIVGDPMHYTSAPIDVNVVPLDNVIRRTYLARKVLITGLKSISKLGVELDEQQVILDYSRDLDYQARLPWAKALLQGLLDGATIRRDRFFAPAWGTPQQYPWIGGCPMFFGHVGGLSEVGRQSGTINVNSVLSVLDTQMPRDLFAVKCKRIWGDAGCGVDQTAYAVTATVGSTPTTTFLPWTGASASYVEGKVYIDNGDSVMRVRKIARADATGLWLVYPLDFVPTVAQTFTAFPGCPGTPTACETYHGDPDWRSRFLGYPFVPVSESAGGAGSIIYAPASAGDGINPNVDAV